MVNNIEYLDAYYQPAIYRLRSEYQYYSEEMKQWVKDNICSSIEKVVVKTDTYGNHTFENTDYFYK